jgi:hypothetical protein
MTLKCAQAISILRCVVVISEGSFRLNVLLRGPLFEMLFTTKGGLGN